MDRRTYLKASGGAFSALALAGCLGDSDNGGSGDNNGGKTSSDGNGGADNGKIIIGSDIPYKPFEYRKQDGSLEGFDPAIAESIFKGQLNRKYEFQKTSFDTIIQSLKNKSFRVIMSAMTITDERAEKVDFSDPYFTAYQTVAVRKDGNIKKLDDLKGKTVGVQKGTTGESAAEDLKKDLGGDLTISSYDQITGAFNALRNQQAAAVINDNTVNAQFVNEMDGIVFLKGKGEAAKQGKKAPDYLTLTVEEYGIAFRKDDDELRKKVNNAIKTIKDDGTYDDIYGQYFEG
ncbi:ABC transporter substrate-binding protein [Haladaptatus sp. R4]|uniref:basic amino acid ABC transporter substrate-binding protein n=1 Tax=unclassified Haladaptatus TaxID=2622732 RepID=UPI0007B4EAF6|nr:MULTISPECIES: basic amino acid ABC transporter substrate-binding protein [unclassified Haladaptatus]KZN26330.1 ABC transporter substrate-binding protein [Haladaptatus sp. R4]MCO8256239.1 transporter substrate-binding domain-containing protein [Haladaptatus sp. AB618]